MLYWVIFYLVEIVILFASQRVKPKSQKILYALSAMLAIYFSAFRDQLGQDYLGYLQKLQWDVDWSFDLFSSTEILFDVLSIIIDKTYFSPVFYFFFLSIITITLIWVYLTNPNNEFVFAAVLLFLSVPGMYFNTFNLTRQFFSAAIFLYAIKYIEDRSLIKYSVSILIASTMHVSSIILWPLYFVLNRRYHIMVYVMLSVILFIAALSLADIIQSVAMFADRYSVYLASEQDSSGASLIVVISTIALIVELMFSKKNDVVDKRIQSSGYMTISVNLLFLFVAFSYLSLVNFYFFRIAVYFIPAVCVVLPHALYGLIKDKPIVNLFCISLSFIYFYFLAIVTADNPLICPDRILPISSLFD